MTGKLKYMVLSMDRLILVPWKIQEKFGESVKAKKNGLHGFTLE